MITFFVYIHEKKVRKLLKCVTYKHEKFSNVRFLLEIADEASKKFFEKNLIMLGLVPFL